MVLRVMKEVKRCGLAEVAGFVCGVCAARSQKERERAPCG